MAVGFEELKEWVVKHAPHTDGTMLEQVSADGERAVGPTPDRVRPLPYVAKAVL